MLTKDVVSFEQLGPDIDLHPLALETDALLTAQPGCSWRWVTGLLGQSALPLSVSSYIFGFMVYGYTFMDNSFSFYKLYSF